MVAVLDFLFKSAPNLRKLNFLNEINREINRGKFSLMQLIRLQQNFCRLFAKYWKEFQCSK